MHAEKIDYKETSFALAICPPIRLKSSRFFQNLQRQENGPQRSHANDAAVSAS